MSKVHDLVIVGTGTAAMVAATRVRSAGWSVAVIDFRPLYTAGDAAQMGPPLTPVSSHDAKIAATNMLEGNKLKPNYTGRFLDECGASKPAPASPQDFE